MKSEAEVLSFQSEGKLAGPWVKELERCRRLAVGAQQSYRMRVDMSALTFIDVDGKALIGQMYKERTELVASGCLKKHIVEEVMQSECPKCNHVYVKGAELRRNRGTGNE